MRDEILSPKLDLAPLPQLPRIPRVAKRLPQPPLVRAFPIPSWSTSIGCRCVRVRAGRGFILVLDIRSEVDQVDLLLFHGWRTRVSPDERRLGEQVLGVKRREERFEEFHLGKLRFEGVPKEDGKVFGGGEEGGQLENLREGCRTHIA